LLPASMNQGAGRFLVLASISSEVFRKFDAKGRTMETIADAKRSETATGQLLKFWCKAIARANASVRTRLSAAAY
jgi:hypothetical protein